MGRLTGARADLAGILRDALDPDAVAVSEWLGGDATIVKDTAVVVAVAVRSADAEHPSDYIELDVWAVSATRLDSASEDDLDAFTDTVLDVLDAAQIRWTNADRAVWKDSHPAYRIETEILT
jgi:hypothetical protein